MHVVLNCAYFDEQGVGDLAIAVTLGDQVEDFQLAGVSSSKSVLTPAW